MLAVPKIGQMSAIGTFPKCQMELFTHFCLPSLYTKKTVPIFKKMPKENISKVGHGPEMKQKGLDFACVSVVFTFIPHMLIAQNKGSGTWKYWPASGPVLTFCFSSQLDVRFCLPKGNILRVSRKKHDHPLADSGLLKYLTCRSAQRADVLLEDTAYSTPSGISDNVAFEDTRRFAVLLAEGAAARRVGLARPPPSALTALGARRGHLGRTGLLGIALRGVAGGRGRLGGPTILRLGRLRRLLRGLRPTRGRRGGVGHRRGGG